MTKRPRWRSRRGLAFWGGLTLAGAALIAFLSTQGLERAGWWAGVIALFVTAFATIHQVRVSRRRAPDHDGSPKTESPPDAGTSAVPPPGPQIEITGNDTVVQGNYSTIFIDKRQM